MTTQDQELKQDIGLAASGSVSYLNHNIPPFTCFIRNEYMFDHESGHGEFTIADVHSVASMEHRVPLFEALLENGVNWTRRPIMAFCWKKDAPTHPIEMHQYWNCFSPYVDVNVRNRLAKRRAELIDYRGNKHWGEYMFTIDWAWENKAGVTDVNFSEDPEHKCGHTLKWMMATISYTPTTELCGQMMHTFTTDCNAILATRSITLCTQLKTNAQVKPTMNT